MEDDGNQDARPIAPSAAERAAKALRANLRRRKEQVRARAADPTASELSYRPEPVGTIKLDRD